MASSKDARAHTDNIRFMMQVLSPRFHGAVIIRKCETGFACLTILCGEYDTEKHGLDTHTGTVTAFCWHKNCRTAYHCEGWSDVRSSPCLKIATFSVKDSTKTLPLFLLYNKHYKGMKIIRIMNCSSGLYFLSVLILTTMAFSSTNCGMDSPMPAPIYVGSHTVYLLPSIKK